MNAQGAANVAAFGGDPAQVVLAGESAGGASMHNHLVREASLSLCNHVCNKLKLMCFRDRESMAA